MNRSALTGSSIALLLFVFVVINGISNNLFSRYYADFTEEGLYTLSDGSKNILAKLDLPVTLKLYYSKTEGDKFPLIKIYGARIADLLKEYARQSSGKVNVEVFDPRPDTEDEEWADKYGVTPMDLPSGEKVYMGLVGLSGDGIEDIIPAFNLQRQEFLEYDVTKLLYTLNTQTKPSIGVMSPLSISGSKPAPNPMQPQAATKPWIFLSQLEKLTEVKNVPFDVTEIPADITNLMLIHPRGLSEATRYALDQYVMRGGNLFIAEDPLCMADSPPQDPSNPMAALMADKSSNINELTSAWGVTMDGKKVVTDAKLSTPVAIQQGGQPENFIAWLSLTPKSYANLEIINQSDVITSSLENIMFAWAGVLLVNDVPGITKQELFKTSLDSMVFEEKDIKFTSEDPRALLKKFKPENKTNILGVKLSGEFPSSFKEAPAGSTLTTPFKAKSEKPATVIILSDADFMADQYSAMRQSFFGTEIVSLINDNQVLVANIAENLSGNNELIQLRSRGRFTRPFDKVQEIEADAQQRFRQEEARFQEEVNETNRRLGELQEGGKGNKSAGMSEMPNSKAAVMDKALLDEIQLLREKKKDAQARLRNVRRSLREDKESLGTKLFLLNSFLVPLLLIIFSVLKLRRKKA